MAALASFGNNIGTAVGWTVSNWSNISNAGVPPTSPQSQATITLSQNGTASIQIGGFGSVIPKNYIIQSYTYVLWIAYTGSSLSITNANTNFNGAGGDNRDQSGVVVSSGSAATTIFSIPVSSANGNTSLITAANCAAITSNISIKANDAGSHGVTLLAAEFIINCGVGGFRTRSRSLGRGR